MKSAIENPLSSDANATSFVQSYWQQRPGVIRGAISAIERRQYPTTRQVLRLAQSDAVDARLIEKIGRQWQVSHAPFDPGTLPTLDTANWTVLVQGVDLQLDNARTLLNRFRFLPDARLDDLMISVAGDRGGVGPHWDNYDVFLLQLAGSREWQLAPPAEFVERPNQPLKQIRGFRAHITVRLEPMDMLYLPSGWAHNGIARGACTTASIGFRAPSKSELQSAWLVDAADRVAEQATHLDPRYRDPSTGQLTIIRRSQRHPAQIPAEMMASLHQWLQSWRANDSAMREFIGRFLSEPNAQVWFSRPTKTTVSHTLRGCRHDGLALNRQTRMLWFGDDIFINGEHAPASRENRVLLRALADTRALNAVQATNLVKTNKAQLTHWIESGWLTLPTSNH